ncbi:MAG: transglutaminase [Haloferacaceae archaeon]
MPRSNRSHTRWVQSILLVGLLCCSLVAGAGVAAGSHSDLYVTVSSVSVSNDEPTTGEAITVTPTIKHSGEYDGGFQITEVELIAPGQGEVARAENLGAIGSGESLDVPLGVTFDTAGQKRLLIRVRGAKEDSDGNLQQLGYVERPVYVSVSEPAASDPATPPRVQIDAGRAVAGSTVPVTVTVSNGDDAEISDLSLRLDGVHGNVDAQTRISPSLGAGNMTTFTFDVKPQEATETTLKATLRYGDGKKVEAFRTVQVEPLREDVDVFASVIEKDGTTVLQYRVTNHGNAPIRDVAIAGQAGDAHLPSATVDTVGPASTQTVTIPLGSAPSGSATIEASYAIDGSTGTAERTVSLTGSAATGSSDGAEAQQSISAPVGGSDSGGLPLSAIGVALAGLVGVTVVGYREWGR